MEDNNKDRHDQDRQFTIIVNARKKLWQKKEITYEEVVVLVFGTYEDNENIVYTVTYSKGDKPNHEGSLVKGGSVKVKDGMIFNVTRTDKS